MITLSEAASTTQSSNSKEDTSKQLKSLLLPDEHTSIESDNLNKIPFFKLDLEEINENKNESKFKTSFLRFKHILCFKKRRISNNNSGICEVFMNSFSRYYPKVLLHWMSKLVTLFVMMLYVVFSIRGVTKLEEGLNLEDLVPPEHYYKLHEKVDANFFPNCGIVVTFVIYKPITYHKIQTREKLKRFVEDVESSDHIVPGSTIAWFEAYADFLKTRSKVVWGKDEFGKRLKKEFLKKNPQYIGDISFSKHAKTAWVIDASRFYFICQRTNTSEDEKDLMLALRTIAQNSTLPLKVFSPQFVFFEHYASILKNTLLPVGVTIIGMLFVALVFIPHPIAVLCVICSMGSMVLGMMGFMQSCGLALSAITTMQIILGVGVCVTFTVRTSHAFMTATGKTRNERVASALVKVGPPILTGACCSFLSVFSLYYGSSFIFASFFKTTAFALFLGVIHSLVFLPVILSFVGPKRTGKPRLFIPEHAATNNNNLMTANTCNNASSSTSTKFISKNTGDIFDSTKPNFSPSTSTFDIISDSNSTENVQLKWQLTPTQQSKIVQSCSS